MGQGSAWRASARGHYDGAADRVAEGDSECGRSGARRDPVRGAVVRSGYFVPGGT